MLVVASEVSLEQLASFLNRAPRRPSVVTEVKLIIYRKPTMRFTKVHKVSTDWIREWQIAWDFRIGMNRIIRWDPTEKHPRARNFRTLGRCATKGRFPSPSCAPRATNLTVASEKRQSIKITITSTATSSRTKWQRCKISWTNSSNCQPTTDQKTEVSAEWDLALSRGKRSRITLDSVP